MLGPSETGSRGQASFSTNSMIIFARFLFFGEWEIIISSCSRETRELSVSDLAMSDLATARAPERSAILETDLRMFSAGELPWDDDRDFADLVMGRRIAVVGPARTLIGRNRGDWINSHDLIVRFNEAFTYLKRSEALPADLGSRTDVLYCNQVVLRKNILDGISAKRHFITFANKSNLKYAVCTNNSLSYDNEGTPSVRCEKKDMDVPKRFARFLGNKVPGAKLRVVTTASALIMKWLNGNWGRTGFVALVDLLGHRPAHLSIAGMTFYHGGGHLAAKGLDLHPRSNRDGTSSTSPEGLGHDSHIELEIFRRMTKIFRPMLEIDQDLIGVLNETVGDART